MKELIVNLLKQIEEHERIKILFAVESGSRAWRMESSDSDYDVRFVYVRPVEEYVGIHPRSDVIERTFNRAGEPTKESPFIDIVGFDILKFARLLCKSNPSCVEWLNSDIVYYGEQNPILKNWSNQRFSREKLYLHYRSLCYDNYHKYIVNGNDITSKRYLYCMRGAINATYVQWYGTLPPISLMDALELVNDRLPEKLPELIKVMIYRKQKGYEKGIIKRIPEIDNFLEEFFLHEPQITEIVYDTAILDDEVKFIILENYLKT
jgi:hypothetical protein